MIFINYLIYCFCIWIYINSKIQFALAMNVPSVANRVAELNSWKASIPINSIISESHESGHYYLDLVTNKKDDVWNFQTMIGFESGKLLCIHRWKIWWAIPRIIPKYQSEANIPPETHLLLGMLATGNYLLLLPLIDQHMGFSLEGGSNNSFSSKDVLNINGHENSNSDSGSKGEMLSRRALIISEGDNLYSLLRTAFYLAKSHLHLQLDANIGNKYYRAPIPSKISINSNYLNNRFKSNRGKGPMFIDNLGWCSWDSFYTDLSTSDILDGLASFRAFGVQPRFMILDDGWQHTTVNDHANGHQWGGRLTSFYANFKFSLNYSEKLKYSNELNSQLHLQVHDNIDIKQDLIFKYPYQIERLQSIHHTLDLLEEHSLEEVVRRAKQDYGIKHLLVWHTLSGYWAGVHPENENQESGDIEESEVNMDATDFIFKKLPINKLSKYKSKISYPALTASMYRMAISGDLDKEPFTLEGVGLVKNDRVNDFFCDYHQTLQRMGVDGVKVDAQSIVPSLRTDFSGWETVSSFHAALKTSVGNHFSQKRNTNVEKTIESSHSEFPIIHCMCHSQGTLLSILALYPTSDCIEDDENSNFENCRKQIPVVRGSDDFWPTLPSSHGPHIFANAINSLIISFLGLQDWDMFQTGLGPPSFLHAASRAISGGPVYISDRPNEHGNEVLQLLAFPNGKVPRCLRSLRPVEEFIFTDPQKTTNTPLLLQNINPAAGLVIGAFNVFGSVLENDRDFSRTLSFEEVIWSLTTTTLQKETYRLHYEQWQRSLGDKNNENIAKGSGGSTAEPWFMDPIFEKELQIRSSLSPLFVEELADEWKQLNDSNTTDTNYYINDVHVISRSEYIGYRFSDKQIFLVDIIDNNEKNLVSITLNKPHAYEIVSFSPKHFWKIQNTLLDFMTEWISVIGAVDLMNSGGAVLSIELLSSSNSYESDSDDVKLRTLVNIKKAKIHLMGGFGRYHVIISPGLSIQQIRIVSIDIENDKTNNNLGRCKLSWESIIHSNWTIYEIKMDSSQEDLINNVIIELLF